MLTGKQFRLKAGSIAIETIGKNRVVIQVPAGSIVTVKSGTRSDDRRMVNVYWDGHNMVMFAEDLKKRGDLVSEASA